jgi:hypothetical protein
MRFWRWCVWPWRRYQVRREIRSMSRIEALRMLVKE